MRKSSSKRRLLTVFLGQLIVFLTVTSIVTVALMVYGVVEKRAHGDVGTISAVMLLVTVFLSTLFTLADIIRRKKTVDDPVEKILIATEKMAKGDFSIRLKPRHSYGNYDSYDLIVDNMNMLANELQKSEVLKTDFISNVSHEIKTPLAIIRNYVALMNDSSLDEETRTGYAQTVIDATKRLTNLISDILKLSKLENNELSIEYTSFFLDAQLEECILQFESIIEKKELEIDAELDPVSIISSPSYLEIIWNNLISNAIKFTEKGGRIGILVKKTEKGALVEISDTGCGISKDVGEHIFDKFYQGDTSHSGEGNGLGLALVKKVIDTLGGKISVSSEQGKGSTFTVLLNSSKDGL
ncbi:MAG: HAMP domain-containing histidine kinase [Clostridia bacterium]|nr:HAMP domain-containing histidine kinase [Clostridia bacterium]